LIDAARANCDALDAIVCEKPEQSISGSLRARWLRELHPDVTVRVVEDVLADDDSAGWARFTIELLGYAPDVVFTSEEYGDTYARYLGAEHVCVDRARASVPISATLVRGNPHAHRAMVAPCVWAYLVPRVVLVGAESSGKTTLCRRLAAHFSTAWVAEYGREYTLRKYADGPQTWTREEFTHIAREQQRREDAAARTAGDVLICDTDAFATELWLERYLGAPGDLRGWPVRDRPVDLYLVPEPDVAFVQDGIRDGEHLRRWMHSRFLEELAARRIPHRVLAGTYEQRERHAFELAGALTGRSMFA
jgi:NadR type nicotinamide-nucleotide adenylyltransferase